MTVDLTQLAAPAIVEQLDFQTLLYRRKERLLSLLPDADRTAIAETLTLASEPLVKLLEESAYCETILRARANDVARANLLAFALGTDLDQLGAFYNLARLSGEADERYRIRIQLRIAALAGNGTREQYRLAALTASLDVVDAAVQRPVPGSVDIALWIRDGADPVGVLAAVRAAFAADDAHMIGIPINVRLATARVIAVTATVYREPSAPIDLPAQIALALPAALAAYAKLGRDLSRSWLMSRLHVSGVARIELASPSADIVLAADEYAVAGPLALADGGVAW